MSRRPLWKPQDFAVALTFGVLAGTGCYFIPQYSGIIAASGVVAAAMIGLRLRRNEMAKK